MKPPLSTPEPSKAAGKAVRFELEKFLESRPKKRKAKKKSSPKEAPATDERSKNEPR